jgi:DNA polymerase elongation subunit (family B)
MIKLADVIAKSSYVSIGDVLGAVKPIETALIGFCREKGIILPDKRDNEKTKFDGAIVYDTVSGRHGWGFSVDLAALYPSAIMMLGISPETIVMQCHGEYDDYVDIMTGNTNMITATLEEDGSVIELPANELKQVILDDGFVISANGTILTGEIGVFAEFTKYAFEKRKHYKNLMKTATDEYTKNLYDLYQKVFKIFANSIYGVSGQISFRLYDIRISKSTTLTGQVISKFQAYKSNELMTELDGMYE